MEEKTGKCDAIKPNFKAQQKWKKEMGRLYSNRSRIFKNAPAVFFLCIYFSVNIFLFL